MEVLKPELMSSEDSATKQEVEEANDSGSGSDDETKKLICHKLRLRNSECQEMMDSLDQKFE